MNAHISFPRAYLRPFGVLGWVWGFWGVLLILKALQHQLIPVNAGDELALGLVIAHVLPTIILLVAFLPLELSVLFSGALLIRLLGLLLDRLGEFRIPFLSSPDADGFFVAASRIAEDPTLAGDTYGGMYTAVIGYLFHFVGVERILGQYLSVLCGVSTVVILAALLRLLQISARTSRIIVSLAAFMPLVVAHSSILLRESIIQMLIVAALYAFIRGLVQSKYLWSLLAIVLVLVACVFHAGVIGVLIGFAVTSAFVYFRDGRFHVGVRRLVPSILAAGMVVVVALLNPDLFLGKFQTLDSPDDLIEHGLSGRGGSAYLTGIEVTSWPTFFLYAPIRAFYFIAAPVPWDWRGFSDILASGMDTSIYLMTFVLVIVRKFGKGNTRIISQLLTVILLVTCLIFGVGVSNSGTAIRHRGKLLGISLTLLAVILDTPREREPRQKRSGKVH